MSCPTEQEETGQDHAHIIVRDGKFEKDTKAFKQKLYKISMTVSLLLTWMCTGLYMELSGPTLKDLIIRLCTTYEKVSTAVSGRSAGTFIGVVLGGILVDKFGNHCYLFLGFCMLIASVTTITLPWVTSVDILWIFYCILGITIGFKDIGGQRLIFKVFKEKATSPLHIVHLGYGTGAFIAPLIANPFLADLTNQNFVDSMSPNFTNVTFNTTAYGCMDPTISSMEYAYTIIGLFTVILCVHHFLSQFTGCYKGIISFDKENSTAGAPLKARIINYIKYINPATCAGGNFCFGSTILILLFCKYFFLSGMDRVIGTFLRSFTIDQLNTSKDQASYLNTVYWICYAVSRLITFIMANWIPVKVLLMIESLGTVICMLIWAFFALNNVTVLWVVVIATGLIYGSVYPTGMAWGNAHIEMRGLAMTWIVLGNAFGGITYLKLGGMVYDNYGPSAMIYGILMTAIITCIFDSLLTVVGCLKSRITNLRETKDDEESTIITVHNANKELDIQKTV